MFYWITASSVHSARYFIKLHSGGEFVSPLGPVLYQHVRRTSLVDMERIAVEMPAVLIDVFNAGENRIGYFELRTTARHFFAASFRFRTSTFLRNSLSFFWSIFAAEVEPGGTVAEDNVVGILGLEGVNLGLEGSRLLAGRDPGVDRLDVPGLVLLGLGGT